MHLLQRTKDESLKLMLACACELDTGKEGVFCVFIAASRTVQIYRKLQKTSTSDQRLDGFAWIYKFMIMSQMAEIIIVVSLLPC